MEQSMRRGERTLRRLNEPFEAAMALPDTREIVVTAPGRFRVEGDAGWSYHDDPRLDFEWLEAYARLAGRMSRQDIWEGNPAASARLPGGQRATIVMPPVAPEGSILLTIRQRAKSFNPTLEWLDSRRWFDFVQAVGPDGKPYTPPNGWVAFFDWLVTARMNMIFDGEIGCAKTTAAEACAKRIPAWENVGTFESTPEWFLDRENWLPHVYAQDGDTTSGLLTAEQTLQIGQRERLDRILFGELRTGEAWAWLRALQTGARGSIATIHGGPGFEGVFHAIHPMIRQHPASVAVSEATIREMLSQHIDVVIHCQRKAQNHDGVPYRCAHIEIRRLPE